MGLFNKKLKGQDLNELQKRNSLISQYFLTAQALELQKRVWLNEIINKMGFDTRKSWEVDGRNGKITELRTPEIKQNEPQRNPTSSQ